MRLVDQSALENLQKRIVTSTVDIDAGAMGSGPASMTIESAAKRFGHTNQIKLPSHNLTIHQHPESGNVVVHHVAASWLHQSAHGMQCGAGSGPASLQKHLKACK